MGILNVEVDLLKKSEKDGDSNWVALGETISWIMRN